MPHHFEKFKKNEELEDEKLKEEGDNEKMKEKVERFKSVARVIGEDFDMGIEIGKQPGWRYIFKPINKIEVDPNDIKEKDIEYCFGIIAHEGSHRKISRIDFIPKKIWQERGFSFLMNAVEDPRVNNWVTEKYDGAREWLEKVYNQDLSAEEKGAEIAKRKIGYIPKHIQFGLEIIRYWHAGKFSENLPKEVKEALEKTIKYAELAYQQLPDTTNPSEEEISEAAKRTYKIVYSAIWPEYQKLIDKALEDEKMRQMIKEMIENGEIEIPPEGFGGGKEKKEKEEERKGKRKEKAAAEEGGKEEGAGEEEEKKGESPAKLGGELGEPLPLDELPDDLRKKLQKKIKEKLDSMPEEKRKELEEKAKKKAEEILDDLEEDENEELKGKLVEQPETEAEEKKRKEQEDEEAKRKKELEEKIIEIEKQLEKEKDEYQKAYEAVKPYIDQVAEDLINLFVFKRWPQFRKSFPGQRLHLKGAFKYEAKKDYRELFERRLKEERKDFVVSILVDLSGSMRGKKIEETFKGVVLFAEALERVKSVLGNLKVAIYGFQDNLLKYKDFNEELSEKIRKEMNLMKREVEDEGKHNRAAYNNDGYCLDKISKILEKEEGEDKFLFVLSDGLPDGDDIHHIPGYSEENENEELLAVVKKISENTNIKLLGIGLGPGTDHVKNFYSKEFRNVDNMPNVKVEDLAKQLALKLEELIK